MLLDRVEKGIFVPSNRKEGSRLVQGGYERLEVGHAQHSIPAPESTDASKLAHVVALQ